VLSSTAFAAEEWQLRLINDDGFGDPQNIAIGSMGVHGGYLYMGTWNFITGGNVCRSSDGKTYAPIGSAGFGNPNNFDVISLEPTFPIWMPVITTGTLLSIVETHTDEFKTDFAVMTAP